MPFLTMASSAYNEYMVLLDKLKDLIRRNKDESEKGEQLRAKMDELWFNIPEDKRRAINKDVSLPNINIHE
jgi:hypothetical protein